MYGRACRCKMVKANRNLVFPEEESPHITTAHEESSLFTDGTVFWVIGTSQAVLNVKAKFIHPRYHRRYWSCNGYAMSHHRSRRMNTSCMTIRQTGQEIQSSDRCRVLGV